jgi:hypothetical protein
MSKRRDPEVYMGETVSLPFAIEQNEIVYKDRFKTIEKITAKFEGFNKEYFVSDVGEKAAVLVICGDRILIARQYRLFINGLSYEVPGGRVDVGESPEQAAVRECLEETGISCSCLKPLIAYDLDLEYTRNRTHVFYSEDACGDQSRSMGNHIWLPAEKCLQMVYTGEISDSLSILTILAYIIKKGDSTR